ncbi:MAG: DUF4870 domain-containing protein [Chthoniobacteraceae bacterium]
MEWTLRAGGMRANLFADGKQLAPGRDSGYETTVMETPPIPPSEDTPAPEAPLPPPIPSKEERTWAMVAHLSALSGHFIPPVGQILGPLVVWILKRDEYPLVNDQAKEALNAQISFTIYFIISVLLMPILIGFALFGIVWLADLVLIIIAAVAANEGKRYRYPFIFRWIK